MCKWYSQWKLVNGKFTLMFPTKNLEHKMLQVGYKNIIGVDEVGYGALAGPVVVCALMIDWKRVKKNDALLKLGGRDSKQLTAAERERIALALRNDPRVTFQIASASPATIDRINILLAAQGAMRRAVSRMMNHELRIKLDKKSNSIVLVDGNRLIPKLKLPQRTIIGGDQKVFTIACASIIAKVCRDQIMIRYAKTYPQYGFAKHKGYGTKEHFAWLTTIGPSLIHRRSFTLTSKLL